MNTNKNIFSATVVAALGLAAGPQSAMADIVSFDWTGMFTMLDPGGVALANTSIINRPGNRNNQYLTPVSGTLSFDTGTGSGSGTLVPFDWLSGAAPFEMTSFQLQAIGDGMGAPGTLILGNMLFDWNGNSGIPLSIIFDAAGMFSALMDPGFGPGSVIAGVGAIPAVDGTYTDYTSGYINQGPAPIATTEWNTSLAAGCSVDACMGVSPSGALPLVVDTAANSNEYTQGDGIGVAGSPMADGPFMGYSIAIDFTSLTSSYVCTAGGMCPPIPLPAAVWLFGSGLVGLIGLAGRRGSRVASE